MSTQRRNRDCKLARPWPSSRRICTSMDIPEHVLPILEDGSIPGSGQSDSS